MRSYENVRYYGSNPQKVRTQVMPNSYHPGSSIPRAMDKVCSRECHAACTYLHANAASHQQRPLSPSPHLPLPPLPPICSPVPPTRPPFQAWRSAAQSWTRHIFATKLHISQINSIPSPHLLSIPLLLSCPLNHPPAASPGRIFRPGPPSLSPGFSPGVGRTPRPQARHHLRRP